MNERRDATTLPAPRRCPWCGAPIGWRDGNAWLRYGACRHCFDLERLAREACGRPLRDELRQAVRRR